MACERVMDHSLMFEKVSKVYETFGSGSKYALRDVSFQVPNGQKVAVIGRSGSGKSTLLHIAAGIDVPSSGTVRVHERDLNGLSESERTLMRRDDVGLIFQFFHLLPHLSVYDNVTLPSMISGDRIDDVDGRVMDLLERVGLADRAQDRPQMRLECAALRRGPMHRRPYPWSGFAAAAPARPPAETPHRAERRRGRTVREAP